MKLQDLQFCDEDTLIFRTQIGNIHAFDPLVTKYHPKLYSLIFRQVNNTETAQDLAQETFLKALEYKKASRIQGVLYSEASETIRLFR